MNTTRSVKRSFWLATFLVFAWIFLDTSAPGKTLTPTFESSFEFVSPSNHTIQCLPAKCRNWKPAECYKVHSLLSKLVLKNPNLAIRASAGSPTMLIRFAGNETTTIPDCSMDDFYAVHSPGSIQFTNSFFELCSDSEQEKVLLHELIHAADCAGSIAYSKEFVDYFRRNQDFLNSDSGLPVDSSVVHRLGYSILNEALSNTYSRFLRSEEIPEKLYFQNNVVNRFRTLSSKERMFIKNFKNSHRALALGETRNAIDSLNRCIELYPESLTTSIYLAYCLTDINSTKNSLVLTKRTLMQLNKLQMPQEERIFQNAMKLRALVLLKARSDKEEARKLIDAVLKFSPNDPWAKELRELCN